MVNLLQFSHNRKADFKKSCNELRDIIDAFADQNELNDWYKYFEEHYRLPRQVAKQELKSYLALKYDFRKAGFSRGLFPRSILKASLKHFLFLLYLLFKSKPGHEEKNYNFMVEWIENEEELRRFSKLIKLFGQSSTLVVAVNPLEMEGYNITYRPKYKFYNRGEVSRIFSVEVWRGLPLYLRLTRKLKVNFFPLATYIADQYLYYYSIFKVNRAKFCLQERHYQTSAIKNYLFRFFDGQYSTSLQKNVHQLGANGFYYDIDVLFSLGAKTAERAFEYGARIDKVVPVGSMFMEYYWFRKSQSTPLKIYDIIFLGINVSMALYYVDAYNSFLADYYETFQWLANFSQENPNLRIGIKHHSNNKIDEQEMEIIQGTNVKRIDQNLDSYEVGFQAKCVVTFGSTMGFELLTHGRPVLFLDPGGRCAMLPQKPEPDFEPYRVVSYNEFKRKVSKILSGEKPEPTNKDDFCLQSDKVSERIFSWLSGHAVICHYE